MKFSEQYRKQLIIGSTIGALGVLLFCGTLFGYGLSQNNWTGPATQAITRVIPFPAIWVNGSAIRYATYLDDLTALETFIQGEESMTISAAELQEIVIEQLVNKKLIEQQLNDYNVKITKQEVDTAYDEFVESFGSEGEQVAEEIQERYGWSVEKFKEKILKFGLMEQHLAVAVANDTEIEQNKEAMNRASAALERIKSGDDFAAVATELSEDTVSAQNGGDLGLFSADMMVPEFSEVVFNMNEGDISDVITTRFGYHIVKLEEDNKDQVRARHILFMAQDVNTYIQELREQAEVSTFMQSSYKK